MHLNFAIGALFAVTPTMSGHRCSFRICSAQIGAATRGSPVWSVETYHTTTTRAPAIVRPSPHDAIVHRHKLRHKLGQLPPMVTAAMVGCPTAKLDCKSMLRWKPGMGPPPGLFANPPVDWRVLALAGHCPAALCFIRNANPNPPPAKDSAPPWGEH